MGRSDKNTQKIKDTFVKIYPEQQLLGTEDSIQKRIHMINSFHVDKFPSICKTHIFKQKDKYIYHQEKIKPLAKQNFLQDDFIPLAEALDYFDSIQFVHGDLNSKNILWTKNGFKIIDFEPSLLQWKNGCEKLMITPPYADKQELENKQLSTLTDKIGFFYFILRKRKILKTKHIVELAKNFNHQDFFNINDIKEKNFKEILKFAAATSPKFAE